MKAEDIYDFHWQWVLRRGKGWEVSVEEKEIMLLLLREVGVVVKELGRPLNRTMSPVFCPFLSVNRVFEQLLT